MQIALGHTIDFGTGMQTGESQEPGAPIIPVAPVPQHAVTEVFADGWNVGHVSPAAFDPDSALKRCASAAQGLIGTVALTDKTPVPRRSERQRLAE